MTEPASGAAAGAAGWKILGGAAGAAGIGAGLVALVAMLMTLPRSWREWAAGLISTVVCSIAGGAWVIIYFDLLRKVYVRTDAELFVALAALLGLVFACGLPGWVVVRSTFTWLEKRKDKDPAELWQDLRGLFRKAKGRR